MKDSINFSKNNAVIVTKIRNFCVLLVAVASEATFSSIKGFLSLKTQNTTAHINDANNRRTQNDIEIIGSNTKMKTLQNLELTQDHDQELLYIANNDGSPRWIWPSYLVRPLFLSFYNCTTPKQRLISISIRVVFALRLQKIIFSSYSNSEYYSSSNGEWALFTGTEGPNRKELKLSIENGIKSTFTKVAKGNNAVKTIANEFKTLSYLSDNKEKFNFIFPDIIAYKNNSLSITGIDNQYQSGTLKENHFKALFDMKNSNEKSIKLKDWNQWPLITQRINDAKKKSKISSSIIEGLENLQNSFDSNKNYQFCLAHGDFTPWNTFETNDEKLAIIDWEMANTYSPIGFDFFHFELQNGILQLNKTWSEIFDSIQSQLLNTTGQYILGNEVENLNQYLKLYLLSHISYYVALYNEQEDWHEQINWQIERWNDALLWASPQISNRKTFIKHFFSQISELRYAILKLGDKDPSEIEEGSDLDILIHKEDYKDISNQIARNPLVDNITVSRKSFMSQMSIEFQDMSVLHLDFIWQLKRKAKTFLNVHDLISRSDRNRFDVKVTSKIDNAKYVFLFFSLNNQAVPEKYTYLYSNENEESFNLQNLIDANADNLSDRIAYQMESINTQRENSGFRALKNKANYVLDTLRTMYKSKGFILTFSGVDGAGKSTIIEEIKQKLHQKYRRPITVLRHRPSILPILSAYIHGKEGAEKKSMESLPREGANKSTISSFFRFMYYYMDYFFGQIVINFKYVSRGHIVIYDRYYYDFINDARRTNIQLNPGLIKFGFNFLIKPKYNYFLYAKPEVILARKKELPEQVILDLTKKYKGLFQDLQSRTSKANFICIENIDLNKTLSEILNKVTLKS